MEATPDEALTRACLNANLVAAQAAVAAGASLQKRSAAGTTPLLWACHTERKLISQRERKTTQKKRAALVAWILSHSDGRGTLNLATGAGQTPLIVALDSSTSDKIVHMLLCKGADPTLRDAGGRDAQHYAMTKRRLVCTILLVNGVREWPVTSVGEWRPHLQARFPRTYRRTMRTLLVLGKARDGEKSTEKMWHMRYPRASLCLLPEELLQYLFALITCAPLPIEWLPAAFPSCLR